MADVSSKSNHQSPTVRDLKMDERRKQFVRLPAGSGGAAFPQCSSQPLPIEAASQLLPVELQQPSGNSSPSANNRRHQDRLFSAAAAEAGGTDWASQRASRGAKTNQSSSARASIRVSVKLPISKLRLTGRRLSNIKRQQHRALLLYCSLLVLLGSQWQPLGVVAHSAHANTSGNISPAEEANVIIVKIGALLEESDHEQANMFIRTIKMINVRSDETIRQLLSTTGDTITHQEGQQHHLGEQRESAGSSGMQNGRLRRRRDHEPRSAGSGGRATDEDEQLRRRWLGDEAEPPEEGLTKRGPIEKVTGGGSPSLLINAAEPVPTIKQSDDNDVDQQRRDRRSSDRMRLRRGVSSERVLVKLEPIVEFLADRHSSLEADYKVCQLIESGVQAIVGPSEGASIQHVQSICDNLEIPYFELRPFLGSPTPLHPYYYPQTADKVRTTPPPKHLSPASTSPAAYKPFVSQPSGAGGDRNQTTTAGWRFGLFPVGSDQQMATASSLSESAFSQIQDNEPDSTNGARDGTTGQPLEQLATNAQQTIGQQQPMLVNKLQDLTLNLYPPANLLTSAYIDLIYAWNWTSFAIVYEEGSSIIKLQDLFRESSGLWTSKWQIKLFQFNPTSQQNTIQSGHEDSKQNDHSPLGANAAAQKPSSAAPSPAAQASNNEWSGELDAHSGGGAQPANNRVPKKRKSSFRDIFWQIKMSGEQNILLDVKTENLYDALKQAQQVGLMTERYSYLISSLDLHTIDLEDFKYSRTRMTAFSIVQVAKTTEPQGEALRQTGGSAAQQPSANVTLRGFGSAAAAYYDHGDPRHGGSFDEKYLERLGVHVIRKNSQLDEQQFNDEPLKHPSYQPKSSDNGYYQPAGGSNQRLNSNGRHLLPKYKLSPSVVLERTGAFIDPPKDSNRDWARREMLLSSPASMGLLPSVDRDNEQRLFEFFVQQQERNLSRVRLSTSSAIIHDSLLLYMLGLNELDPAGILLSGQPGASDPAQQQPLVCSLNSQPWLHGSSLLNYMHQISFTGLTGPVSFDQRGLRADFKLDMMGMAPNIGLVKVGEWRSRLASSSWQPRPDSQESAKKKKQSEASNVAPSDDQPQETQKFSSNPKSWQEEQQESRSYDELSRFYETELRRYNKLLVDGVKVQVPYTKSISRNGALKVNDIIFGRLYREQADQVDTLIVTTKLSQPYFMLKETPNKLEGNDQYEGFAVDLIHELSKLVNFKYRWREVADKKYGSKEVLPNGTVKWNGMIGEIVRGQADLAIVDLTITAQREEAVDFTLPFMNTGISILFKKPTTKVTTLFSFLSPFSNDVWAYVLAAYCGISANLFLVGHLSPYEWADPHPCRHRSDEDEEAVLKNQFSLLNSFWFTIGSLMQQGSDLTPRSMSTRTIAGIWYFFTLIMISSYTANLAAFLTVEKVVYPIENVRDLSGQEEIKYGCVESGSTCTFFHDSQIDTYKKINETMRKFRTYVRSNDEGQKRVEEGKFAFFMESASIEYIVERNCNLTQIGGLLDSKGYGLATNKKSKLKRPYRTLLSEGILHLQETGMLHILKNRWWKERRGGGTCTDDSKGSGVTELSLANVGGVFVVLLGGLGISFLVAIAEFMWRARRSGSTRDRICEEMMNDLKFALACKSSTKPVAGRAGGSSAPKGKQIQSREGEQIYRRDKRDDWRQQDFYVSNNQPNQQQQQLDAGTLVARFNSIETAPTADRYQQQQLLGGQLREAAAAAAKGCARIQPLDASVLRTLMRQQHHQFRSLNRLVDERAFLTNNNNISSSMSTTNGGRYANYSLTRREALDEAAAAEQANAVPMNTTAKRLHLVANRAEHILEASPPVRFIGGPEGTDRRHWILAGNSHSKQQQRRAWQPDAAGKRRLLFAQQTIDTAHDESLAG